MAKVNDTILFSVSFYCISCKNTHKHTDENHQKQIYVEDREKEV